MKKVAIIGGGPIGLKTYIELSKLNLKINLFEANKILGGQLTSLYPLKQVNDLIDVPSCTAREVINSLIKNINQNDVFLNTEITSIDQINGKFKLNLNDDFIFDFVVLAEGIGFSKPCKIGVANEEKCSNIVYTVKDFNLFKDKKVVILGGGDTALDWAKHLNNIASSLSLVHRRNEFRGNKNTIKDCKNLCTYLSFIVKELIIEDDICKGIKIVNTINNDDIHILECDYILVSYGNIAFINKFMFCDNKTTFDVENHCRTSIDCIFAVGDNANYQDKIKRIQPGFVEVDELVKLIRTLL